MAPPRLPASKASDDASTKQTAFPSRINVSIRRCRFTFRHPNWGDRAQASSGLFRELPENRRRTESPGPAYW